MRAEVKHAQALNMVRRIRNYPVKGWTLHEWMKKDYMGRCNRDNAYPSGRWTYDQYGNLNISKHD